MTVQVKLDVIKGASARFRLDSYSLTRAFIVSGLTGDRDYMMVAAAAASGVPQLGSLHPTLPILYLDNQSCSAVGASSVRVLCNYQTREGMRITFGATENVSSRSLIEVSANVQGVTTFVDYRGDLMKVYRTGFDEQQAELTVLRPNRGKSFTLTLPFDPSDLAELFVGKINNSPWYVDPYSTRGQWLCTNISGRSEDNGRTYPTVFSFLKKNLPPTYTWDEAVPWRDPATQRPVPNAEIGNGIAIYQLYEEIDFNQLGL